MVSYLDRSWCMKLSCKDMKCPRNQGHIPDTWEFSVSLTSFPACEKFGEYGEIHERMAIKEYLKDVKE